MNRARRAATLVFLLAIVAALILLAMLSVAVATKTVSGEHGAGQIYLLFIQNHDALGVIKGMSAILTVGAAAVAAQNSNTSLYYSTIIASLVGILLCIIVFVGLGDTDIARQLYDNPGGSTIVSSEKLRHGTQFAVGGLAAWFTGLIATQLGINPVRENGND
jgi:hypothetical protein